MFNHAEDIPFAVCDPRTNIDLADVVSVDRITHEAAKEVAYFSWNPAHRWYWMSNQTPDEIVIMTQYDTHPPGGFFNSKLPIINRREHITARQVVTETGLVDQWIRNLN